MVSLDRFKGSGKTLYNPSGGICIWNKTESVNLNVFDMITRLPKHISGDWECKFDRIKCNSNQPWYNKTC